MHGARTRPRAVEYVTGWITAINLLDLSTPVVRLFSFLVDKADVPVTLDIDGERVEPTASLHDGAELTLMPAFTGGRREALMSWKVCIVLVERDRSRSHDPPSINGCR